ncbi:MAG: helicase-related protein [Acidimicrobiaceae bacterium]|nr:helicase-related protein [Acidimicrobiaceae bacterium]
MTLDFNDLAAGMRLAGVVADAEVTVVAVEMHGVGSATLTYRTGDGGLGERIIQVDDLAGLAEVSERRWSFDADGAMFRLASEARRMRQAHLADPFAAVDTSNIDPYPHQIDAVYNRLLTMKPLRFLLADDPGAGKTIMSGLLIRELVLRGDVARCLIVAPGSLVEQWQDELWEKFGLSFELMSRAAVEASRTGNPFTEKNLLIARVDQLSRSEELMAKVRASDWDLVIVDEAHKMAAHRYGDELRRTKRFLLGEVLRECTRHLLLLTATPHNGKNEDFLAFMTLIDPERFAGRLRGDGGADAGGDKPSMPDVSDVMRRLVKENLRTFEGRRLFPQRHAHSLNFELSDSEAALYKAVTKYVSEGMNRAARMSEEGDKSRGIIVGFALAGLQRRLASSPAAIYHSLRRRRDRLAEQAAELRRLAASGQPVSVIDLPKGVKIADLEDFDFDDYDDAEREELEDVVIDAATAAGTAEELEAEVAELEELVELADDLRRSGVDTKWLELRDLLRSDRFAAPAPSDSLEAATGSNGGSEPVRKLIVFSEHKDTLEYVAGRIEAELGRPEAVVRIHGGIRRHDRRDIQDRFRVDPTARVLVATDAAGEGVNLQAANMVVNYDLPWNPNRIEQRFGRVHRIGQQRPCHLWNLVAFETREGKVFERLFDKIEEQRGVYGDQVYDVLGDAQINKSLRELLMQAIASDEDPARVAWMDEVIDTDIGRQMQEVLDERALVAGLADPAANDKIRRDMEIARARRLQPWFVESFFTEALRMYGGRITGREQGRFEITRVPAAVRACAAADLGPVHDRYERVTFDKARIQPGATGDGPSGASARADLISPGTPLLAAVVNKVLADFGGTLQQGAVLVDEDDPSTDPRLLVYLDHTITDGRQIHGTRQVVSRRFHYVEIDRQGNTRDPGDEPYLNYAPLAEDQQALLDGSLDFDWAGRTAEETARSWAIEHLAGPHFDEVAAMTRARVAKVWDAVRLRLESEIRYWDQRTEEIKAQEIKGKKPRLNSGRARARADELQTRLARRRLELAQEDDLHNSPPTIVAAAVVVPQGLLDKLAGRPAVSTDPAIKAETDRRAVAAVMKAERKLGRIPEEQHHSNPGFDVLSEDPATGVYYFIEVKGHLPQTEQISVSRRQVGKAHNNSDRWRLAVVSVPEDPTAEPEVRYLTDPFKNVSLHPAQTSVPLNVSELLVHAGPPT